MVGGGERESDFVYTCVRVSRQRVRTPATGCVCHGVVCVCGVRVSLGERTSHTHTHIHLSLYLDQMYSRSILIEA